MKQNNMSLEMLLYIGSHKEMTEREAQFLGLPKMRPQRLVLGSRKSHPQNCTFLTVRLPKPYSSLLPRSVAQAHPTLRLQGLQHARLPCPWPSPRICSNWSLLSRWCHPTILSAVTPPFPPASTSKAKMLLNALSLFPFQTKAYYHMANINNTSFLMLNSC